MALQAQCILFKRCSEDLAPFKYAGYPMLLQAISLPDDDSSADGAAQRPPTAHFLGDEIAPRLMVRQSALSRFADFIGSTTVAHAGD